MMNRVSTGLLMGVVLGLVVSGCSRARQPAQETWMAMGTFARVTVPQRDRALLSQHAGVVRQTMVELENSLSLFKPDSDISRLNRRAGDAPLPISERARVVLGAARKYAELSGGCFDPTVAPLVRLWGFHGGPVPSQPPPPDRIGAAMLTTGYRYLLLTNGTAQLVLPGMSVDLGGIAKGYAVDIIYDLLRARHLNDQMVDLGGNIRCGGGPEPGRAWQIGVRDPFDRNRIVGTVRLTGGMAVATSGNYERFVTIANRRYAHIVDPRTGYPVRSMAAVTVIADSAAEADALSTALFVAGVEEGARILKRLPRSHALFILDEQPLRIQITRGFQDYFSALPALTRAVTVLP